MVTSVVTSTIITTRLEGPQIQLTRCLLTGCTAVNFDYEEIANPVPDRKYLQVNTVPYTYFVLNLALVVLVLLPLVLLVNLISRWYKVVPEQVQYGLEAHIGY